MPQSAAGPERAEAHLIAANSEAAAADFATAASLVLGHAASRRTTSTSPRLSTVTHTNSSCGSRTSHQRSFSRLLCHYGQVALDRGHRYYLILRPHSLPRSRLMSIPDEAPAAEGSPAAQWFQFMLSVSDPRPRIWDFPEGGPPSEILAGHRDFPAHGGTPKTITIADMYQGRRPFLWSPAAARGMLDGRQVAVAVGAVAILDSNVLDAVHLYRTDRDRLKEMREPVRDFLLFLVERGFDLSPIFYYYEATARATDPEHWREIARARAETVLALQTMDTRRFLRSGGEEIVPHPRGEALQLEYSGAGTVDELLDRYAGAASQEDAAALAGNVRYLYASLLKAALIQHGQRRRGITERYRMLGEFMTAELGVALGPERFVGLFYFARPSGLPRFLPDLGPDSNRTRFLGSVLSASWDLLLLRLPENLLGATGRSARIADETCVLPFLCTADGVLRKLATSRVIRTVFEFPPEFGGRNVIAGHTTDLLEGVVGEDVMAGIVEETLRADAERRADANAFAPISPEALEETIRRLEEEVAAICRRDT